MNTSWTRRRLILTGSAGFVLATTGCRRIGQHDTVAPTRRHDPASPVIAKPATPNRVVGGMYYEIVDGDTLSSIARRSGTSVQEIYRANHMTSTLLIPHQKIWLPGVTAIGPDPLASVSTPDAETVPGGPHGIDDGDGDIPNAPGKGYALVKRSSWTRRSPRKNARAMGKVTRITVHHTSEHGGLVGLPDIEVVKRIENYHRNGKKWCAIGYHYLIGKDGRVYEGRPVTFQGAHVLSENENNIGISMIGDYNKRMPSERQLAALRMFLDDTRDRFHVAKSRVYGHRDLNRSICPGEALYTWLRRTYKG